MNLYQHELSDLDWTKFCGGNTGSGSGDDNTESCVEIAPIQGLTDVFALRDSKNPEAGTLRFTGQELTSFVETFRHNSAA